jgi:2-polyprenyl-3-methyl-5-hydroxy-6-metoxy-1,4-benzoquinol methylase
METVKVDASSANASNFDGFDNIDDESLASWDPEGDPGRRYLLNPTIFGMLGPLGGQRILDAGCGQGYLSRPLGIRYLQRDLSRLGAIDADGFDAVVANMVLLDIADWEQAMANCLDVLRGGGRFIFSLLHPLWAPGAMATWTQHRRVELSEYLEPYTVGVAHGVNFHRPLSAYLNCALRHGATIDEIAEPAPPAQSRTDGIAEIAFHIPNFIVISVSTSRAGVDRL